MSIHLDFSEQDFQPINATALLPQDLLAQPVGQIEQMKIGCGRETAALGDLCKVSVLQDDRNALVLEGAVNHLNRVGLGMKSGHLVVEGNVSQLAGAAMSGGILDVHGSAGDLAGASMTGGLIRIHGSAGELAGSRLIGMQHGMNGGEIMITGDAGSDVGSYMRRGLIVVGGDTQKRSGYAMQAGTILVFGKMGCHAGLEMQRGSIVAGSTEILLPGFRPSCRIELVWLRIYFRHLKECGMSLPEGWTSDSFYRFIGQFTQSGKGEVLLHEIH